MELEENLSYQRELLYVVLREATYEVPQDVLVPRLEFLRNFPFLKDKGTEKGRSGHASDRGSHYFGGPGL